MERSRLNAELAAAIAAMQAAKDEVKRLQRSLGWGWATPDEMAAHCEALASQRWASVERLAEHVASIVEDYKSRDTEAVALAEAAGRTLLPLADWQIEELDAFVSAVRACAHCD